MFNEKDVTKIIELHEKSYALFKWLTHAVSDGSVNFNLAHQTMDMGTSAEAWLDKNYVSIPLDARPERTDLKAFGHLLASYLTTSYDVPQTPEVQRTPSHGCGCGWCGWVVKIHYFKPRKITDNARDTAMELKRLYLTQLSKELLGDANAKNVETLLQNKKHRNALAMATYVNELLRRAAFAGQGVGVVVLWREIAWVNGSLNKMFKLKTKDVLNAEAELKAALSI